MGRHFFCDLCRFLDPTKKGAIERIWRIEDSDFLLHLSTHTAMEFILYIMHITDELYESGKYEVETR